MTAMTSTWWIRTLAAVAAISLAAVASACSASDDPASDSSAEPAATSMDPETVTPSTLGPTVDADLDGAALLRSGIEELVGSSYHFQTVVTAGGSVALQAEGDHVGDGTRFVVLRDDASVEYVVTPDGTWVMPEGEEWRASDIDSTTANPLPALDAATIVTVVSSDGTTVTLVATVPDTALGYEGDGVKDVTVTVIDGEIDNVRYDTTVQGLAASLLTRISPVTDDAPVVAPI
jgi:hypothetical protein